MVRGIEDRVNKLEKIRSKKALIGIIGLGYVGLPLSYTFWKSNIRVLGFDIDSVQIGMLERGEDPGDAFAAQPSAQLFIILGHLASPFSLQIII